MIADCIMDLIKHFSLFVCSDSVPLVIKRLKMFSSRKGLCIVFSGRLFICIFRHAKRTQINADDVLLLARKSSTLVRGSL